MRITSYLLTPMFPFSSLSRFFLISPLPQNDSTEGGDREKVPSGSECLPCADKNKSKNEKSNEESVPGSILLNNGTRVGMGLKLGGVVQFADSTEDDEGKMSLQNSALSSALNSARRGIDSPYDSIFQLRQSLYPLFPVDFDSNTSTTCGTPSLQTPLSHTPSVNGSYVPLDATAVVIVLNSLEEKCEEESEDDDTDIIVVGSDKETRGKKTTASVVSTTDDNEEYPLNSLKKITSKKSPKIDSNACLASQEVS